MAIALTGVLAAVLMASEVRMHKNYVTKGLKPPNLGYIHVPVAPIATTAASFTSLGQEKNFL